MHTNSKLCEKSKSLLLLIAMAAFATLAIEVQASAQKIITIDAPGAARTLDWVPKPTASTPKGR